MTIYNKSADIYQSDIKDGSGKERVEQEIKHGDLIRKTQGSHCISSGGPVSHKDHTDDNERRYEKMLFLLFLRIPGMPDHIYPKKIDQLKPSHDPE